MDIRLSSQAGSFSSCGPFPGCSGGLTRRPLPDQTGESFMEERVLQPGFSLYYTHFSPRLPVVMSSDTWPSGFGLIFLISGKIIYNHSSIRQKIDMTGGMNRLAFHPGSTGSAMLFPGEPIRIITITFTTEKFLQLMGSDLCLLPSDLRKASENPGAEGAFALNRNTSDIQYSMKSLVLNLSDSKAPNLLIEGLIMELLGRQLMQFSSHEPVLSSAERGLVIQACEVLAGSMEDPPKLTDLARDAGLSPNRLSQGFKIIYGKTPFAHLRELRLNRAYELLSSGKTNVTEAAMTVGYDSLSHFSRAFFNRFGIRPCDTRPRILNR
ncbi:MAG: helix-turn-helix transcriptional regulator [Desulfobacteraceae bacterium]|nr:helix-turn-helix transcriptional regulator [Desulfobacteraceae bacterium]